MKLVTVLALFALGAVVVSMANATDPHAVVIPGNGASYDPHAKLLAEIRDELKAMREDLKAQRSGALVKPGADRKIAREQVLLRRCAGCHTPARIEGGKDGGALILFTDDESKVLKPLSPKESADVADYVLRGSMPPKPREPVPPKERELFE